MSGFSEIAVSDGCLYFTAYIPTNPTLMLFAVNASTGQLIWSSEDSSISSNSILSPAVVDGIVYTTYNAHNASTGQLMFNYTRYGGNTSPTVSNGMIFMGTKANDTNNYLGSGGGVLAINAKTGEKIWSFTGNEDEFWYVGTVYYPPAVTDGVVYFSAVSGVYALNAQTGSQIWHSFAIQSDSIGDACIAVGDGCVYINVGGQLHCLDASSGLQKWAYSTLSKGICPAVVNGVVYDSSFALDALNGTVLWDNGKNRSSPAVAEGLVYYVDYSNTGLGGDWSIYHELLTFNSSTGNMISNYTFPGIFSYYDAYSSPVIANDMIYFTQSAGENSGIYAFGNVAFSTSNSTLLNAGQFVLPAFILTVVIISAILLTIFFKKKKKSPTTQI